MHDLQTQTNRTARFLTLAKGKNPVVQSAGKYFTGAGENDVAATLADLSE